MRTYIALFELFQRDDAHDLLLLYSCFFALCALVTLIFWVYLSITAHSNQRSGRPNTSHSPPPGDKANPKQEVGNQRSETDRRVLDDQTAQTDIAQDTPGSEELTHTQSNSERITASKRYDAISAFRTEYDSGEVRFDEAYSIVYQNRPQTVDNLRAIKGIPPQAEELLHKFGCFTYKQIALWAPETCNRVNKELNVQHIEWTSQSHQLYRQKYGHSIEIPS